MLQLLTRKVDLERKNYKHELGIEKSKRNEMERKLVLAMQTIENLKDQIEVQTVSSYCTLVMSAIKGYMKSCMGHCNY